MKYKTILWDIDGTLLNFEMSEKNQHGKMFREAWRIYDRSTI